MHDLNDLYYYVQSVTHGGFSPAGRSLGLAKSKLSRRIALLEERLGVRLLQRSSRQFAVTEIGQTYLLHCKAMLEEAQAAQDAIDLSNSQPRGVLKVSCPIALLHAHLGAMLADFMVLHPQLSIHLDATNRVVDVVGEAMDLAFRVRPGPLQDSELILRVLSDRGGCLAASPALVARMGPPQTPADLSTWPSLALGSPHTEAIWRLHRLDGAQAQLPHTPRMVTDDMVALRCAALAGVGVVQLPTMMVCEQLKDGSLVRLLPDWAPHREIIHAVYPSRRGLLPSVRALIDFLADRYAAMDED
jgi:DNA-binding transcriptional LysR family regulator